MEVTAERRPRWVSRAEFVDTVLANQTEPGLMDDLEQLTGEVTDELPFS